MPSPGSIANWRVPPGSVAFTHHGDVRVDSGVQQGDQVSSHAFSCATSHLSILPVQPHARVSQVTNAASPVRAR